MAFQLRKAQASRVVSKIVDPSSKKTVFHPKDIAEAFSTYYRALYDSPVIDEKVEKIRSLLGKIQKVKNNGRTYWKR